MALIWESECKGFRLFLIAVSITDRRIAKVFAPLNDLN